MDCRPSQARNPKGEMMRSKRYLCVCSLLWLFCCLFTPFGNAQGQNPQEQKQPQATQAPADPPAKQPQDSQAKPQEDGKLISVPGGKALGMSILGNQEA